MRFYQGYLCQSGHHRKPLETKFKVTWTLHCNLEIKKQKTLSLLCPRMASIHPTEYVVTEDIHNPTIKFKVRHSIAPPQYPIAFKFGKFSCNHFSVEKKLYC